MATHLSHPSQATTNRPGHLIPAGQGHVPDTASEILAFDTEVGRLASMAPAIVKDLDHLITLMEPDGIFAELDIVERGANFFQHLRQNLDHVLDDVESSIDVYIHFRIHNGPERLTEDQIAAAVKTLEQRHPKSQWPIYILPNWNAALVNLERVMVRLDGLPALLERNGTDANPSIFRMLWHLLQKPHIKEMLGVTGDTTLATEVDNARFIVNGIVNIGEDLSERVLLPLAEEAATYAREVHHVQPRKNIEAAWLRLEPHLAKLISITQQQSSSPKARPIRSIASQYGLVEIWCHEHLPTGYSSALPKEDYFMARGHCIALQSYVLQAETEFHPKDEKDKAAIWTTGLELLRDFLNAIRTFDVTILDYYIGWLVRKENLALKRIQREAIATHHEEKSRDHIEQSHEHHGPTPADINGPAPHREP